MKQPLLLEVNNLRCYRGPVEALRDVSIVVKSGEVVCIIGANGAGKTSLILSLIGLAKAHQGSIKFQDKEIRGWPPHKIFLEGMAFVPEDRRVFPDLTVKENLELGFRKSKQGNKNISYDDIIEIFPPISKLFNRKGVYLSGGEQKMVAVARSLMSSPELILLDEPLEGLAPTMVERFTESLKKIKEMGITVIQAESNVHLAERIAERFYALERGEIIFEGTQEELIKNKEVQEKLIGMY